MSQSLPVPEETVRHIVSTFRGKQHYLCQGNWLVELSHIGHVCTVGLLVDRLEGWSSEPHPTRPTMLHVTGPVNRPQKGPF